MNRLKLLILFLGILLSTDIWGQSTPYHSTNGTEAEEVGYGIVMLADRTTITVGYTKSGNEPQLVMMRLAQNGAQMWAKTLSGVSLGRDIYQTSDGNFVLCGYVTTGGNQDFLILKIDADGNILWSKSFGGTGAEEAHALMEITKDDGSFQYAIVGKTTTAGNSDGLLLLLAEDGTLISSHIYQTSGYEFFTDLNHDPDGNLLILSGETDHSGTRDALALIVRENGLLKTASAFDGGQADWFNAAEKGFYQNTISNTNYYWLGGASVRATDGKTDMLWVRVDSTGAIFNGGAKRMGDENRNEELFSFVYSSNWIGSYIAGYAEQADGYNYAIAMPVDGSFNIEGGTTIGRCGNNQIIYDVDDFNRDTLAWTGTSTITSATADIYSMQNTDNWGISVGCQLGTSFFSQNFNPIAFADKTPSFAYLPNEASLTIGNISLTTSDLALTNADVCAQPACNLQVNLGADLSILTCEADTAVLTAQTNDCASLLWSTGDTTASITVNTSGEYWVQIFDGSSCEAYDTINVAFVNASGGSAGYATKWYFGDKAGLDFSSGAPTPLLDGEMFAHEGCTVINDDAGNLLMYSDGISVWNRNHETTPNGFGLQGDPSATQSGLFIPSPEGSNIYYLFTVPSIESGLAKGVRYSKIDMTLDGGLGDIVSTEKDILLYGPTSERITASRHANGRDYWVITHDSSDGIRSYLITENGIQTTSPIISNVSVQSTVGQLKVSPDGKRLALATGSNVCKLFDFNNASGEASNPININLGSASYGVEFSPNSQVLYLTRSSNNYVSQYDLNAGNEAAINASRVNFNGINGVRKGSLQLGPDGKIYIAEFANGVPGSISVIENPNVLGTGANYQNLSVSLGGRPSRWGLPSVIQSGFAPCQAFIEATDNELSCDGTLNITSVYNPCYAYQWLKDGIALSGENDTLLTVSEVGDYQVVVSTNDCSDTSAVITIREAVSTNANYANTWYFGQNAGLDFSSGVPLPLLDGQINTLEGCAVLNDANGNLLFYTDGITVYNKNHDIMLNGTGLQGDPSATQSGIIVPKPQDENIYYIFTVPKNGSSIGLRFSEVDIRLDGGLGGITSTKNELLVTPVAEKITSVLHENQEDYWVITHGWGNNRFYSFLVTKDGINTASINSDIGINHFGGVTYLGQLKASPDAKKLGVAIGSAGIQLFDFNNSTGVVSNTRTLTSVGDRNYGIEFSPNSQLIYATAYNDPEIRQFDISSGDEATINSTFVDISSSRDKNGLQLGPDGKIYVAELELTSISVIHNPNIIGTDANFEANAIDLGGRRCKRVFPAFIQSGFAPCQAFVSAPDTAIFCNGSVNLTANYQECANYQWLKDGVALSGANDTLWAATEAGNYQVVVSKGGCSDTSSVVMITQTFPDLGVNLGNDTTVCAGSALMFDSGTAGFDYEWSDGSTNPTFSFLPSDAGVDTLWVEATDGGCSERDTVLITVLSTPQVNFGNDTTLCDGQTLRLSATQTGVTYLWSDNSTDSVLVVSSSGTYSVLVDNGSCQARDTIVVNFTPQPDANLGADFSLCLGDSAVFDAQNTGFGYLWSDNSTSQTFTFQAQTLGMNTVWVEVGNATCSDRDTVLIDVLGLPTVNLGNDTTLCDGQTLRLSATQSGVTYLWSDNSTDSVLTVSTSGTYSVLVDNGSCQARDTIIVNFTTQPDANLGADFSLCLGDSAELDAQNTGFGYLWSDNSTGQKLNFQAQTLGVNTVWVEVGNATCSDRDTVLINVLELPTANLGNDTTLCDGQTLRLSATQSGVTYLWSDNSTDSVLVVSSSGTYSVLVDNSSCQDRDTIVVNFTPQPDANLGTDFSLCLGDSAEFDAQNTGFNYLWSDNSTGQTFTFQAQTLGVNTVWVEVGNATCSDRDTVSITVNPLPTVSLGTDQNACAGDTILLDAGNAGASFLWSDNSTGQQLEVTQSGVYTVTVNDGCVNSDTIAITYFAQPSVDLGKDTALCLNETISLDAGNSGQGFSYLWSDNSTGQLLDLTSAVPQSNEITVKVFNAVCEDSDTVQVNFLAPPSVDLGADRIICQGDTITLDAQNAGAGFLWSDNSMNQQLEVTQTGEYFVQVTAGSCSSSDTVSLEFVPLPKPNLGIDQTLCYKTPFTLDASVVDTRATYTWNVDNVTDSIRTFGLEGEYIATATVGECIQSDTVQVTYRPKIGIDLGANIEICIGDTAKFDAGSGFSSYLWSIGEVSQQVHVSPNLPTKYSVVVTDAIGCEGSDTVEVLKVHALPKPDLGSDLSFCEGTNETILAPSGFVNYIWVSGADTISESPSPQEITLSEEKNYSLIVTDSKGCVGSDTVEVIEIYALPIIGLPDSAIIDCSAGAIALNAGSFADYTWNTGSNSQTIRTDSTGIYSVFVLDFNGCGNSDSVLVINPCNMEIVFPNAFSPNDDNENELFLPKGLRIETYQLTILDRWGNIIFQTSDLGKGWDGTLNGKPMMSGVYTFKAVYTGQRNRQLVTETKIGSLLLLR